NALDFNLLSGEDYFNRIIAHQTGEFTILSSTRPSNWSTTGWKVGLIKLDINNNVIWETTIDTASSVDYGSGGLPNEFCYSQAQNAYFVGCVKPINSLQAPIGILSVDQNGNLVFNKELNTPYLGGGGQSIHGILDNGQSVFLAGSGYQTPSASSVQRYLYKVGYNGDSLRFKAYDWVQSFSGMDTNSVSFIMTMDPNGDSLTTNYYGNNQIVDVKKQPNAVTYGVLSNSQYTSFGDSTWIILDVYNDQNILLHNNIYLEDSSFVDISEDLKVTDDGGYLITANRYCVFCLNSVDEDAFLIKTDSTGKVDNLVWPGDANSDGIANIIDILPIGIGYGNIGPLRANASLNWQGQPATDFGQTFVNGVDYKHADCNGDGLIDLFDANAILLNYGLTHSKGGTRPHILTNPNLSVQLSKDTTSTSNSVIATINLGESTAAIDSVYGAAFTLNYDPALVDSIQMNVDYTNSWFGDISNSNELIAIDTTDIVNGKLHIGLTRTNQVNTSGFGEICSVEIFTTDNISGKQSTYETLHLNLSDEKIIRIDESEIDVNVVSDSVVIFDPTTVGISGVSYDIPSVFPNPSKDWIAISGSFDSANLTIYDITGKTVLVIPNVQPNKLLSIEQLNNGLYTVVLSNQLTTTVSKLIVK
ncbi:MAG: T9SS type A sorting domain-containing protein, partial [Flavobacteriales bacterium]|nr:T9SS type A sorting domain-containing protein [Flavobacteriales bacterium]